MSRVTGVTLDSFTYWGRWALAFIYFGFAAGISYPVFLKFSFTKAYIFTMLPVYVIAVGLLLLTKKTNFISNLSQSSGFSQTIHF
jgi:hypothetical protein